MNFILQPCQLLLLILAGWINRQQQEIIEYLRTEYQVLRESHGRRQIKLNDDQRRLLASRPQLSSGLGRKRAAGSAWNRDYQETRSSFGFVDHTRLGCPQERFGDLRD
jgi:hypothetical protein